MWRMFASQFKATSIELLHRLACDRRIAMRRRAHVGRAIAISAPPFAHQRQEARGNWHKMRTPLCILAIHALPRNRPNARLQIDLLQRRADNLANTLGSE